MVSSSSLLPPKRSHQLATAFLFLFTVFLLSTVFFSKHSLEPSTTIYTNPARLSSLPPLPSINRSDLWLPPTQTPFKTTDQLKDSTLRNGSVEDGGGPLQTPLVIPKKVKDPILRDGSVESDVGQVGFAPIGPMVGKEVKRCDLYNGRWVRDEDGGHPIYEAGSCPYVDDAYTCQENGRKDGGYMKWRWKPDGCDLPRFNGTDFLERLRGKRLMLVGDSMNRNQFESLLCMLHQSLTNKSKMYETRGHVISKGRGYFIFKFEDYDCTVEFVRSHFLVREGLRSISPGRTRPTLMIDRIDKPAPRWKRADILVFNTGHWWTHGKTSRGRDYYQEGDTVYPKFDPVVAFTRAMKTWATWIDNNIDPKRKLVFYRGYSTAHFRGGDWDSGGTCNGEKEPTFTGSILDNYPAKMKIVEDAIRGMKFPVVLLNVTKLTNFRKDGHPSIYGKKRVEGERVSSRRQDCSHWCLPGVPDAWNELIYANLVLDQIPHARTR